MQSAPYLSIITPSFNQGAFIARTLESIIQQPGDFGVELIVMDGGSTDNTVEILKAYEAALIPGGERYKKNLEFRWVSEKDRGQSDALNKGFRQARGEIVAWLNSDDYYFKDVFTNVERAFREHPDHDVVFGDSIAVDIHGQELWRQHPEQPSVYRLLYIDSFPQPSVFFRRRLFERTGYVDEELHYTMDAELWARFVIAGAKFKSLDQYLSAQLYHVESKSMQGTNMFESFRPEIKRLRKKYRPHMGPYVMLYELKRHVMKPVAFVWDKLPGSLKTAVRMALGADRTSRSALEAQRIEEVVISSRFLEPIQATSEKT